MQTAQKQQPKAQKPIGMIFPKEPKYRHAEKSLEGMTAREKRYDRKYVESLAGLRTQLKFYWLFQLHSTCVQPMPPSLSFNHIKAVLAGMELPNAVLLKEMGLEEAP